MKGLIDFYMNNARLLREGLQKAGIKVFGGVNAPYVWLKTPNNLSSWDFFDLLLSKAHLVGTRAVASVRLEKATSVSARSTVLPMLRKH